MKINLSIDIEKNPMFAGEILRQEFFKEEYEIFLGKRYRKLGCYAVFDLAEDVVELPEEPVEEGHPEYGVCHVSKKVVGGQEIIMKYFWEGDGTLEFHFLDGSILYNDDCKSDQDWVYEK